MDEKENRYKIVRKYLEFSKWSVIYVNNFSKNIILNQESFNKMYNYET